jgi:alkanesulfonate monooxygenase SsuD/methylene tetrahydromethanopterin reductase-like flavin-dependent oxidoreductase (luciferase family)
MDVGVMVTSYNHGDWDRLMAEDYGRPPAVPDWQRLDETLAMGELVEPLGFDSIWTTEHYGSAYSMQPNPLQWLAYWAGRTERVDLGTAVVVAPWWNPVRLAHEISMLDILLRGRRLLLGLGRGVSEHEYASLGVPRDQSREYFHEVVDILRLADSEERFSYDGKIFKIPATMVRPQPRHRGHLLDDMRAAFTTRASAQRAAEAGLGQLFVAGEPLAVMGQQVAQFNQIRASKGLPPDQPTSLLWMYCAETEAEADEGYAYFEAQQRDARRHYFEWNTSGFEGVRGYEEYAAKPANDVDFGAANLWEQRHTQPIGTPEQILEKITTVQEAVSLGYLVIHAFYADMPKEKAEKSLRLFAQEVLPALHEMLTPIHPQSLGSAVPVEESAPAEPATAALVDS